MFNSDFDYFNYLLEKDNTDDNRNNDINYENNICLISNNKLEDNYITLKCNHKFNYIEIYNEVYNQKINKILDNKFLKINEIKCPYCRQISNFLLPYYSYYKVKNERGVTAPKEFCLKTQTCCHIYKNGNTCKNDGCLINNTILCNKHCGFNIYEDAIIRETPTDTMNKLRKLKKTDLIEILKNNNLKITGNKIDLIYRILVNKINLDNK
tara:strand:+ start:2031 stop:2660 length:630 start_codon:yes stop_codon:yes gene_type:complete